MNKFLIALFFFYSPLSSVSFAQQKEAPVSLVVVEEATKQAIAPVANYTGTVISRDDAQLSSEIDGRLVSVADVGEVIKKGAPVVKLDDVLIKEQVLEYQSAITSEQARLDFYNKEVTRLSQLAAEENIARNQLDQAISNQAVSRSNLAASRAKLAQVQEQFVRTQIVAPFDGVITERILQAGEWAKAGDAIVRLVNTSSLEIQTRIPATILPFVKVGENLKIQNEKNIQEGKIRAIVPVGEDQSRLYELRISMPEISWPSGQLVRVEVPTALAREAITVPQDALVLRRDGISVYRVNGNMQAERIVVETGIAQGHLIEVIGEIQPGDKVVTRGGERLQPGAKVKIITPHEPS